MNMNVLATMTCITILVLAIVRVQSERAVSAQGTVIFSTQGDITTDGSTAVAIGVGTAAAVDVIALSGNSGVLRCADSTVSASRGVPIAAGGTYRFGAKQGNLVVDLTRQFCFGANGDKFAIMKVAN